jgi:signal transduction histidine kinase
MNAHAGIILTPAFWHTLWFRAVCAVVLAGLPWAFYRMRVRHVAREFERTLDARVAERTRIARDLHDTLLGSFDGVLLHLEAASILFQTRPAEAKRTLDSTIAQAARVINEGREAVQGLRSSVAPSDDLAKAIGRLAEELSPSGAARPEPGTGGEPQPAAFRVLVEGAGRRLHPIVRDEVYRIATEALRNAFQHSRGTRIEVDICYHVRQFRLRIRDDGLGVDAQILASEGRDGHFGLKGMHERAELAGGKLTVWSAPGAGTELELTIPGARAYSGTRKR